MRSGSSASRFETLRPLSALKPGDRGVVVRVTGDDAARADRLAALGVTAGARVVVLQTFPGIVFECDETELAVERGVARAIWIETRSPQRAPRTRREFTTEDTEVTEVSLGVAAAITEARWVRLL